MITLYVHLTDTVFSIRLTAFNLQRVSSLAGAVPAAALPIDSDARWLGTNRTRLQSFCAPLAWCKPQGVSICSMDAPGQRVSAFDALAAALSPGGMQTVLSVMNGQRLMGELETLATTQSGKDNNMTAVAGAFPTDQSFDESLTPPERLLQARLQWNWDTPPGLPGQGAKHMY